MTPVDPVTLLKDHTYSEVEALTGLSRGAIYRLATAAGARKTEERIRERQRQRAARQRAAFAEMLNEVVTGDVFSFFDELPDRSIQLVLSSPPYNVKRSYGGDGAIDAVHPLKYFGQLCMLISETERVLADGGVCAFVVGATRDADGRLIPIDWLLQNAFAQTKLTYQNRIVWPVAHGLTPKNRLAERYETIVVYSKGEPVFNPNAIRQPQKQYDKRAFRGPNAGKPSSHVLGAWPSDIWADVNHLGHNHGDLPDHPAAFPVKLAKKLIVAYTRPGDTVCDPYRGSGTTHVAAIETGRNFIGSDLFYEDVARERIAAARPDVVSPLSGTTPESRAFWSDYFSSAQNTVRATAEPISDERDAQIALELFGTAA